jgi:hypothetical protein
MCLYWKKLFLCGCVSHVFRERCTFVLRNPHDPCPTEGFEEKPRKSHFMCYDHIKALVEEEKRTKWESLQKAEEQRKKDEEKARKDKIRKDAEMRAEREREEERTRERDRKAEIERQRREGSLWVDAGGSRKGKGKKGGARSTLQIPYTAPAVMTTFKIEGAGGAFAPLSPKDATTVRTVLAFATIDTG